MTAQSTPDQLRFQGRSFVKFFGRPPKTNEIIASLLYRAVCGIGGEGGIRAKSRYAKRIVQCLKTARRANSRNARIGGEGGIRTPRNRFLQRLTTFRKRSKLQKHSKPSELERSRNGECCHFKLVTTVVRWRMGRHGSVE